MLRRLARGKRTRLLQELQIRKTELEIQNQAFQESQAKLEKFCNRYSDLYHSAPVGYFIVDRNGVILEVNFAGEDQLGEEKQRIVERPFLRYVAPEDQIRFRTHLAAVFQGGGRRRCEIKMEGKTGPFDALVESLLVKEGGESHCWTVVTEVVPRRQTGEEIKKWNELMESRILLRTAELRAANQSLENEIIERMRAEQALTRQANLDPLTGLYNRRYFDLRASEEIARADRKGVCFSILLCDLDEFKAVNDLLGYTRGDWILKAFAQTVLWCTRESDLIFRWRGDEIAVLLTEATREGVLLTAERIRREVEKIGREAQVPLHVSIGAALYPEHGATIDHLISVADRALSMAKQRGGRIQIGKGEHRLDHSEIRMVFQPVVDLRSNRSIGYEALARDTRGKLTAPELFKEYQAIGRLGELKRRCFHSQLKEGRRLGMQDGLLFLNVDFHLLNDLDSFPKPEGMDVVLEISESEVFHSGKIKSHLALIEKWRTEGFRIAIDDFGSGSFSFSFVERLAPDYIKIDRSTLLQAVSSPRVREFLNDLVFALRNYTPRGMIAEGIETEQELSIARELGVEFG
ncbi:MAG TPA: diguanylate cyclase, partial [Candidatus Manganitrophaceae bacterium]|nr:diguanylate cyclase [Candidatus Manganitrophaceae bacterium]